MTPPGLAFVAANERAHAAHQKADLRTRYWDWTLPPGPGPLPEVRRNAARSISLFALRKALDLLARRGTGARGPAPRPAGRGHAPGGGPVGGGRRAHHQRHPARGARQLHHLRAHAGPRSPAAARLLPQQVRRRPRRRHRRPSRARRSASPTWGLRQRAHGASAPSAPSRWGWSRSAFPTEPAACSGPSSIFGREVFRLRAAATRSSRTPPAVIGRRPGSGSDTFLKLLGPRASSTTTRRIRSAVSGPTMTSPPARSPRSARPDLVTGPVAVKVQRWAPAPPSLVAPHQRLAGVDPHVQRDGGQGAAMLLVEINRLLADGKGGARGVQRMVLPARFPLVAGHRALEDHHEAVARRLVHVAVVRADDLEEGREVSLHHVIELVRRDLLAELGVPRDVEEEDGHLPPCASRARWRWDCARARPSPRRARTSTARP